MDAIKLNELAFYGYHGVKPEEKAIGQRFRVNLTYWLDTAPAGRSDDMADSVSYSAVYRAVQAVVEGPSCDLIEAVAAKIAREVLGLDGRIQAVDVEVVKPDPPIRGHYDSVSVQIHRDRAWLEEETGHG